MSPHSHRHPRGVSLIELSVVIAMILSLTSGLFFSASYYRDSANQANCIVQLEGIQKAVRSYQNFNNLKTDDPIARTDLIGPGKVIPQELTCPQSGGTYIFSDTIPAAGTAFAYCQDFDINDGLVDKSQNHTNSNTAGW